MIYEYGRLEYGVLRAGTYAEGLKSDISLLCKHPHLGMRIEAMAHLRKFPSQQHHVFYRVIDEDITIERIIHSAARPI